MRREPVERGNLTVTVSATGKLAPTNQVTVGSRTVGPRHQGAGRRQRPRHQGPAARADRSRSSSTIRSARARRSSPPTRPRSTQAQATLAAVEGDARALQEVSRLSGGRVPAKTEMETGGRRSRSRRRQARAGRAGQCRRRPARRCRQNQTQRDQARSSARRSTAWCSRARSIPARPSRRRSTRRRCSSSPRISSKMKLEVAIDEADVGAGQAGPDRRPSPSMPFPARPSRRRSRASISART